MSRSTRVHRQRAGRVTGGRPLRRNNWRADPGDFDVRSQAEIRLERRAAGPGYRHVVTIAQLRAFIDLLPDWEEAGVGLDAIVLDGGGSRGTMGWCRPEVIALCAWDRGLWWNDASQWFIDEHRELLDVLQVERVKRGPRQELRWTEDQARAIQLCHVLPHELGHHHDRATNRGYRTARGEPYAEAYARRAFEEIWAVYPERFGFPCG